MTNELLKKHLGCQCIVSTGSFGSTVTGVLSVIEDNWIEVTANKGPRLLSVDFVPNITQVKKG